MTLADAKELGHHKRVVARKFQLLSDSLVNVRRLCAFIIAHSDIASQISDRAVSSSFPRWNVTVENINSVLVLENDSDINGEADEDKELMRTLFLQVSMCMFICMLIFVFICGLMSVYVLILTHFSPYVIA